MRARKKGAMISSEAKKERRTPTTSAANQRSVRLVGQGQKVSSFRLTNCKLLRIGVRGTPAQRLGSMLRSVVAINDADLPDEETTFPFAEYFLSRVAGNGHDIGGAFRSRVPIYLRERSSHGGRARGTPKRTMRLHTGSTIQVELFRVRPC